MPTLALFALIFTPFVVIVVILYFFTKANSWKPELLEADEYIVSEENEATLIIKHTSSIMKGFHLIATNKRIFLLRGKYRYMTLHFEPTLYLDTAGKIKKSFSTQRFNLFTTQDKIQFKTEGGHEVIAFEAKTYLGLGGEYELLLKNTIPLQKILGKKALDKRTIL